MAEKLDESASDGTDRVSASISYTLGTNVGNLSLTGSADMAGTVNELANSMHGNAGNNSLAGGVGNDSLGGGLGNDTLKGGAGLNWLTGGADQDFFVFDTVPGPGTFSTIMDFSQGDTDRIHLAQSEFAGFSHLGELTSDAFYAAAGATAGHDSLDRVIYDTTSGKFYYDADGLGGGDAFLFAVIGSGSHPVLTYSDFQIIA